MGSIINSQRTTHGFTLLPCVVRKSIGFPRTCGTVGNPKLLDMTTD